MRHTTTTCLFALLASTLTAQIRITEVMQSNIDCVLDDLNDYPDSWVEIYNDGAVPVELSDYSLGEHEDGANAWRIPAKKLAPGCYALIYCDKEQGTWHASFKLDIDKNATLFLFDNQGKVVERLMIPEKMPAPNISYGRLNAQSDEWGYQYEPTPEAANCGKLCTELLGEPQFSITGQVFTSKRDIEVELTLPEGAPESTEIHYTLDGSEPTLKSSLYTDKMIKVRSNTVLRAKCFHPDCLSPRSTTQSYIFLDRKMTLPVVSIVTDNQHFYSNKTGIYVDGTYSYKQKNYEYNWRRPINFEYYEAEETESAMNQLCETRVSGAASRSAGLRSLALYTNKRFDKKHFKYEFFPDQRPGQTHYKSIMMRNAGNDFDYLYMRDAIIQRSVAQHADLDWQAWRPVIFFLNGKYKGILNIRERSNEDNIYTNYNELEDIVMVENGYQLKAGDWSVYKDFWYFYQEEGHTYEEYAKRLDMVEYMNLMIMNLYYNNQDFPGNNLMIWRPAKKGGRWRYVAKDTDFGLGLYGSPSNYNTIKWINDNKYDYGHNWANKPEQTMLFRHLMDDKQFQKEFLERAAIYMGDFLNFNEVWKIWEPMYKMVKEEYPIHRKLFNQWWPNYDDELRNAKKWLQDRTDQFYKQVSNYYKLGTPVLLKINNQLTEEEAAGLSIKFNDITLSRGVFDGKFYVDHDIILDGSTALDADGRYASTYTVTGWTIQTFPAGGVPTTEEVSGPHCEVKLPSCTQMLINANLGQLEGLEEVIDNSGQRPAAIYDLNGTRRETLQSGFNLIRMEDGSTKKVYIE